MGLLSRAYYMSRMYQQYIPSIKNVVNTLMDKYTNSIEPEEWTAKVADVDVSTMTYDERKDNRELALQMAELMDGKCENLAEAIRQDPAKWGDYLQSNGIDSEKIEEMQQKVAEGGDVPSFEVIKLAISGSSSAEATEPAPEPAPEPTEPSADEPTGPDNTTPVYNFASDTPAMTEPDAEQDLDNRKDLRAESGIDSQGAAKSGLTLTMEELQ